ncbi:TPA: S-type pyocin domain-containing protein [Pseudomonas putida]|nr:S-type pyocin domain-containing protein [Pseudomonas putida]HEK1688740.1 S-type pyocin domain-containing protein [Pseudomonas putida]
MVNAGGVNISKSVPVRAATFDLQTGSYTGVELQPLSIEAETYPGVVPDILDLIITFPADSGLEPIYLMFSEPLDSGIFTRSQLDKKYKHAKSFGIADPQKNGKTLAAFRDAIQTHLEDKDTLEKGSYLYSNGSRVYFNPTTKNVVILDSSGAFLSGWKLSPGTPQYEVYINTGRLK